MTRSLPKKIAELGRIRIGDRQANSSGKGTHPHKLQNFRFTSGNKPLLHFAANLYGGEVQPWVGEDVSEGQYELYSNSNALDVLVPTSSAITVSYEQWRAGGCTLRCTGEMVSHSPLNPEAVGRACQCPLDDHERSALAQKGSACTRVLRLNVILPDLPGIGVWRLDTKGFYATAELLGSLEMLQMGAHQIIEAALRLESRKVKRFQGGKSVTLQFAVPVLWPKYTPRQMLAAADQRLLLMAQPEPAQSPQDAVKLLAAELYGEPRDAQDFDQGALPPTPGELKQEHIAEIDGIMRLYDEDDAAIAEYWQRTCRRFKVEEPQDIKAEHLQRLAVERQEYYEKRNAAALKVTAEPAGATSEPSGDIPF